MPNRSVLLLPESSSPIRRVVLKGRTAKVRLKREEAAPTHFVSIRGLTEYTLFSMNLRILTSEFVYMCAKLDGSASWDSSSAGTYDAAGMLACAERFSSALKGPDIAMGSCL